MEKKIVICSVFFIVTQSSVLLSSANFTGFSEKSVAIFEQFTSQDRAARLKAVTGFTKFFNLLKNGTGQTNTDHSVELIDLTPFHEALSLAAEAVGIAFNASTLILDNNCTVYEIAVNESLKEANGVIHQLISSIALAHGGNYEENQSDIEINKNLTEIGFVKTFNPLFDLLRCCSNDNSYEYKSLIEDVQKKLNDNLKTITKALYEAIEVYGIITSVFCIDEAAAARASIEKNEDLTLTVIVETIEEVISLMETRYVNIYINGSSISHDMYKLRLTRKKVSDRCEETVKLIFVEIVIKLLGHTNDVIVCDLLMNSTDLTEALAIRTLQDAKDLFLDTVSHTLPDTTDAVKVARLLLTELLQVIIGHYYYGIGLAETEILTLNLDLLAIKTVEDIQSLVSNFTVKSAFKIYGNNANTAVRLAELEEIVRNGVQGTNKAIFTAIEVMAKGARKMNGATQKDFDEIEALMAIAISEINIAVHYLVGANVRRLIVEHGY